MQCENVAHSVGHYNNANACNKLTHGCKLFNLAQKGPAPFVYTKLTKSHKCFPARRAYPFFRSDASFKVRGIVAQKLTLVCHATPIFYFALPHSGALYHGLDERDAQMDNALERALAQAENDATFRKVKRMSYSSNAAGEVRNILPRCQHFADYQISLELIYKYFINTLFHSYFIHIPYQLTLLYYYYILYYLFIKNLWIWTFFKKIIYYLWAQFKIDLFT